MDLQSAAMKRAAESDNEAPALSKRVKHDKEAPAVMLGDDDSDSDKPSDLDDSSDLDDQSDLGDPSDLDEPSDSDSDEDDESNEEVGKEYNEDLGEELNVDNDLVDFLLAAEAGDLPVDSETFNATEPGPDPDTEFEVAVIADMLQLDTVNDSDVFEQEIFDLLGIPKGTKNWSDAFLSLIPSGATLKTKIRNVAAHWQKTCAPAAGDLLAYLADVPRSEFASHDQALDDIFNPWLRDLRQLTSDKFDQSLLVKPSGPLGAIVTDVYNWPSENTKCRHYGQTLDSTNPSLHCSVKKNGPNPLIRTQDRLMYRIHKKLAYPDVLPEGNDCQLMMEECYHLNRRLNAYSTFINFHGSDCHLAWKKLVDLTNCTVQHIELQVPKSARYFSRKPRIIIVRDKKGSIQHIIFFSYHPEAFFHWVNKTVAAFHDLQRNFILETAGLKVEDPTFSSRLALRVRQRRGDGADLLLAKKMRASEKKTGVSVPEDKVRECFGIIRDNEEAYRSLLDREDTTPMKCLLQLLQAQAAALRVAQRAAMSPEQEARRAARAKEGALKAAATMRAKGIKPQVKAAETRIAKRLAMTPEQEAVRKAIQDARVIQARITRRANRPAREAAWSREERSAREHREKERRKKANETRSAQRAAMTPEEKLAAKIAYEAQFTPDELAARAQRRHEGQLKAKETRKRQEEAMTEEQRAALKAKRREAHKKTVETRRANIAALTPLERERRKEQRSAKIRATKEAKKAAMTPLEREQKRKDRAAKTRATKEANKEATRAEGKDKRKAFIAMMTPKNGAK